MKTKYMTMLTVMALLLAACGDETGNVTNPGTAEASTGGGTETTAEETYLDAVPALDFGGAQFRIVQQGDTSNRYRLFQEESSGDPVDDAIYNTRIKAEERFNITIGETIIGEYEAVSDSVRRSVDAGDDVFDLVLNQFARSSSDAVSGYFYNWNDLPHIALDNAWYTKAIQDASVGNQLYMVESDLVISYTAQTWMIMYNKRIAQEQDIPDLYAMVDDGDWTIDRLYEYSSAVYNDVNGNSKRDAGDLFGFPALQGGSMVSALVYAGDARLVEIDKDLTLSYPIQDERTITLLGKIGQLLYQNPGAKAEENTRSATRLAAFPTGNFLFAAMHVGDMMTAEIRAMEDSFGVLPLPKYDEAQTGYYTTVDGGADIMTIPKTISNPDLVGAVIEAMSAESYQSTLPAYINLALEQKGTRDEASVPMLRMILASRIIDFATLYNAAGGDGYSSLFPDIVKRPDRIASTIEKRIGKLEKHYQNVIAVLTEA